MSKVELHCDDCLEILDDLDIRENDVIITDPPWGINLNTDDSAFARHDRLIGDDIPFDYSLFAHLKAKEQFWFGAEYFINKPISGSWIVWDKYPTDRNDKRFVAAFELIWSKQKHPRKIVRAKAPNTNWIKKEKVYHPTQKSVVVMKWLLDRYTKPEDRVIDLFMGSGTTGVACVQMNRDFIGVEIDDKYYQIAKRRIDNMLKKKKESETRREAIDRVNE